MMKYTYRVPNNFCFSKSPARKHQRNFSSFKRKRDLTFPYETMKGDSTFPKTSDEPGQASTSSMVRNTVKSIDYPPRLPDKINKAHATAMLNDHLYSSSATRNEANDPEDYPFLTAKGNTDGSDENSSSSSLPSLSKLDGRSPVGSDELKNTTDKHISGNISSEDEDACQSKSVEHPSVENPPAESPCIENAHPASFSNDYTSRFYDIVKSFIVSKLPSSETAKIHDTSVQLAPKEAEMLHEESNNDTERGHSANINHKHQAERRERFSETRYRNPVTDLEHAKEQDPSTSRRHLSTEMDREIPTEPPQYTGFRENFKRGESRLEEHGPFRKEKSSVCSKTERRERHGCHPYGVSGRSHHTTQGKTSISNKRDLSYLIGKLSIFFSRLEEAKRTYEKTFCDVMKDFEEFLSTESLRRAGNALDGIIIPEYANSWHCLHLLKLLIEKGVEGMLTDDDDQFNLQK